MAKDTQPTLQELKAAAYDSERLAQAHQERARQLRQQIQQMEAEQANSDKKNGKS